MPEKYVFEDSGTRETFIGVVFSLSAPVIECDRTEFLDGRGAHGLYGWYHMKTEVMCGEDSEQIQDDVGHSTEQTDDQDRPSEEPGSTSEVDNKSVEEPRRNRDIEVGT